MRTMHTISVERMGSTWILGMHISLDLAGDVAEQIKETVQAALAEIHPRAYADGWQVGDPLPVLVNGVARFKSDVNPILLANPILLPELEIGGNAV